MAFPSFSQDAALLHHFDYDQSLLSISKKQALNIAATS